jgi:hypothetical protein
MSPLVKTKHQANFKDFKQFGVFKGLVKQKNVVFNSFLCKLAFFGTRGPLKRSFDSHFKLAHSCQKKANLHTNSLNKLLLTNALWTSLQRCTKTSTDEFCIFDIDKGDNLIV